MQISNAFLRRNVAAGAKMTLSARELCCAIWATNALSYRLIEDPFFRAQFGPSIPLGLGRQELSEEMKTLAAKVDAQMFAQIGKGMGTLAVDGWTNARHRCDIFSQQISFFLFVLSGKCIMWCSFGKTRLISLTVSSCFPILGMLSSSV